MKNSVQDKIDFICDNKQSVMSMCEDHDNLRFFTQSSDSTYIGVRGYNYDMSARPIVNSPFGKNLQITVIFIDGGVWQYQCLNTTPRDKTYTAMSEFVEYIYTQLQSFIASQP